LLAVQLVAFVVLQVRVVLPADGTVVGDAMRLTVGRAGEPITFTFAVFETFPPGPVQVRVYVLLVVIAVCD
jgi:hypothetical protein